ncbi:stress-response A/B barrel domain-containing protein UP3-like isoform X3 [Ananas comosus]|uniref:Stress-response A/B barrel domain-containing protein UP3-like isoform X3 n=1 Tax=Ananas comosus TaxID=4615 RepID=A0A6P5EFR5_ANACO|nr:stress-response A/B barrel domain-containing protein UP3-like isoform X3 [Ananas comosus]XP_020082266.1 stress-response A/B barrel domain-containing protein UP3-like isoform X3 [Ananas comosus]XP_020094552.1 stress-response A/B barrel domain-containing protein UP3-like isoform X3 [Ananas comosus]XP_020094553.1 stress-response A/B barrel domain-containing protein UP3-like isoform X3 [Ananas comosus]
MPIVAQILYPVTSSHPHRTLAPNCRILSLLSHHPASLRSSRPRRRSVNVFRRGSSGRKVMDVTGLSSGDGVPGDGFVKKRKIVEHIFLLKAKDDLTEHDEKDMLDYLYTCQYQMSGILAISLGRIEVPNTDNFTHALYMRFQKKEDLAKFYKNSYYSKILREHVTPFSYGSISVDYESEVEDDILPIFRRGEEFNYGVECVLLISVVESASREAVEDAVATFQNLIGQFSSFIVQATFGCNLNHADNEYTHAAVIRFPSFEDLESFRESIDYQDMWRSKFLPITRKALLMHFTVDPVGTELM